MAFKLLDNLTYQVKFLYDKPKVWDNTDDQGKAYKSYSYGVEVNQKNEYLNVSEPVHNMLQSFGPLSARTLEISKVQDPENLQKKHWIFKENGVELRKSTNTPIQSENASYAKPEANNEHSECHLRFEKMLKAFRELESRLSGVETLLQGMQTNKEALPLHQSFAPRDVREPKTPSPEEAANIVESYKEAIPVINELPKGFN